MTPRQKAKELIERFKHADEAYYHESFKDSDLGKICALVAVDEILNDPFYTNTINISGVYYWQEVKKEIEKL